MLRLQVPRLQGGESSPELLERYPRSEQALVLALMEMMVLLPACRQAGVCTDQFHIMV